MIQTARQFDGSILVKFKSGVKTIISLVMATRKGLSVTQCAHYLYLVSLHCQLCSFLSQTNLGNDLKKLLLLPARCPALSSNVL